jgi:iron(III) transport system substrate-binding protein
MIRKLAAPFALLAAAGLVLAGCTATDEPTEGPSAGGDAALEELIAAAQEEGTLTFYQTPAEPIAQAAADAFADLYDIEVNFVRLTGGELATRYSAEAEAGAVVADLVIPSYDAFIDSGLDDGILIGLDEADIPGYADFPEAGLIDGGKTAIVTYNPSALSWNTDALGDAPVPESFEDLADPAYEGKILLTDPSASQAYLQFWTLMLDTYGEETVQAIVDNSVRLYPSVVPMTEALAAGEGSVTGPNVGLVVEGAKANGAPLDWSLPEVTTGPVIVMAISADAPSPNAARLFAHFVLSEEGQAIYSGDPGSFSASNLPEGFTIVDRDDALANQEAIFQIFGL